MLMVLRVVPRVDLCFTRIGGTKGMTIFSFPELKRNLVTELEGKNNRSHEYHSLALILKDFY